MASIPFRRFKSNILAKSFIRDGVKSLTASASATRQGNAGRTTVLNAAAGMTLTLPATAAARLGEVYRVVIGTTGTSNAYIVKVANTTDVFKGGVVINDIGDSTAATVDFFPTASTSDTFTLTASIGAGKAGDWVEFEAIAAGVWAVRGAVQGVTDPTTPFSATV